MRRERTSPYGICLQKGIVSGTPPEGLALEDRIVQARNRSVKVCFGVVPWGWDHQECNCKFDKVIGPLYMYLCVSNIFKYVGMYVRISKYIPIYTILYILILV